MCTLLCTMTIAAAEPIRIVALGDSLMAGYRLDSKYAFPVQLQIALREKGHDVIVANAGVSGDTAAGGLARLDWSVPEGTHAVILELGANDALRGHDPVKTYEALTKIIAKLKDRGIAVLIAGMKAPRNMGKDYVETFDRIYPYLAEHHNVLFYPFFLDGVAGVADLNQRDGIHPTPEGIAEIVRRIIPSVESLIGLVRPAAG
ncbi:MAG: arylesterase [Rhizobiales bacterium]|nr:arylesterase [Hyphomicrobiales bacterium]